MEDIKKLIKKYKNNKPIAFLGISNFGGIAIVDYLPANDDFVFGYVDFGSEKNYFLSQLKYDNQNLLDEEEGIYYFELYDIKYNISDFMRI